ncbi:MAG: hypothetical protein RMX96_05440 [Nostoc sp. ChiSLP02]|nr:hypothetical protein [Nostoc sp. DedSLP05]MDZ8103718.1 hypothetical protein [Nostoc sp. DedSLP01]MDZ8184293.1 hypothetical protein [Nostoc sp. ChiSLP02]
MRERLLQAAIITFLLHLIAGFSANTIVETKAVSPTPETPTNIIVSLLLRNFR